MYFLRNLARAITGQLQRSTSSRRAQVRYQVALESLENRTSLSQAQLVAPILEPLLAPTAPAMISPADTPIIEPKDPGGVDL
jgi:hypothetical protein